MKQFSFLKQKVSAMKILKWILGIIALLLALGFLMPGTTHIERAIDINAPVVDVFNQVNELKNWSNWSPWAKLDPNTVWKYSEPSSAGLGAYYTWASEQSNVGKGKITILESKPNELVRNRMEFTGQGEAISHFILTAKDTASTKLVWTFESDNGLNPFRRWMSLFMDKMLGPDYEKGLANIKAYCEMKKQG